jgi:glutamate-5-semialdehyde dehydrogenase
MKMVKTISERAKTAYRMLAAAETSLKNKVIGELARMLLDYQSAILQANTADLSHGKVNGLSPAMIDRLMLNTSRIGGISADLMKIVDLPDPVGEVFDAGVLPNGLKVHKQRIPLGVVGVIYESRPNVTIDIAGIAIKTGNAAVLRGGSESIHTNRVLVSLVHQALASANLPIECIEFIDDPDRERVMEMLQLNDLIDILIPRGGAKLHQFCRENSRIPVITGGIGICHLFVDESADLAASLPLIRNAKIQRPTVCNALDTLLVHHSVAERFLPKLVNYLFPDGVEFRVDNDAFRILERYPDLLAQIKPIGAEDFDTEWLSLVMGIKIVSNLDEAIDHINAHSTKHSDGILTANPDHVRIFVSMIDSSAVYVNASTRFTDGGQLGLGTEVAVSTQRLHARGPMGLREMTTYKWVIQGDYHFRSG